MEYIDNLVEVFAEVRRVLKNDGVLWVNLGDGYASGGKGGGGSFMDMRKDGAWQNQSKNKGWRARPVGYKDKDLLGLPWELSTALLIDGWWRRDCIVWAKPNPMPESVKDRCTKSHEYVFMFTKSEQYYYNAAAIMEPATSPAEIRDRQAEGYDPAYPGGDRFSAGARQWGNGELKNKRSVWTIAVEPCKEAHFATFPKKLVEPCILSTSRPGDTVLDVFNGAGTTGIVAARHDRNYIGIELNPEYIEISKRRIESDRPLFNQVEVA